MVMQPPWSNPDPASVPPVKGTKKATKKPAKKAAPRKKSVAAAAAPPAKSPSKAPAKKRVAKAAKKQAAPATKQTAPTPAATEPAPAQERPSRPERTPGFVEAATRAELEQAGVAHSALAASALAMARNVDEAETAAGASAAARELRIVLPLARTTVNPLSPPATPEKPEDEGNVVGPSRLDALRKRAAKRASS